MKILTLGEKIKKRRKELEMTLKDLAGNRITPGQISLVESGRSNPSMDLLEYLADVLQTSVEYLIESEETQAEKISIYYEKLAEAYILSEDYELAEKYIDISVEYVEKYSLEYRKAVLLKLQANINIEKGEYDVAKELLILSNKIFSDKKSCEDIVDTFLMLAQTTILLKLYSSALTYLRQAEKVYISFGMENPAILGAVYYFMARVYIQIDDKEKSIMYAKLANDKLNKIHNREEHAKVLLELSKKHAKKEDLHKSKKYIDQALDIYKDIQVSKNISKIENCLGRLFYRLDDIDESLKHYKVAKEIRYCTKEGNLVNTLIDICKNYIKIKDTNKCEQVLSEIRKYIDMDNIEELIKVKLLWYRVYLLKETYLEAEAVLLESYKLAKENNLDDTAAKLAITLGKYYIDNKREVEASKYLNEGVSIYKKCNVIKS